MIHRFSLDKWRYKEGQKEWNVEKHFMRMEECIGYANWLRGSPSSAINNKTKKDILFGSFLVKQQCSFLSSDPDKYPESSSELVMDCFLLKNEKLLTPALATWPMLCAAIQLVSASNTLPKKWTALLYPITSTGFFHDILSSVIILVIKA